MRHNKEGILLNGMYLLWKNGYHNTGLQDIIESCGVPKGSFYHLFENKETFAMETLELYISIINTSLEEYLSEKKISPLDRIRNYYINQIELCVDENLIRGCYLANMALELGSELKKVRKVISYGFESNKNILMKGIKEWYDESGYEHILDAEALTDLVQSYWYGALLKTKGTGKTEALHAFLKIPFTIMTDYAI